MDMRESSSCRASRMITLIAVTALHVGIVALLLMASSVRRMPDSTHSPLELVYIPTLSPPPVRAESGRPQRLLADLSLPPVSPVPPVLLSASPGAPSAGVGSRGAGVDWLAEAHRAIRAYEIRRDQPSENALSGKSPANDWWPQQGPHAGDQFKTEAGDWIVWINAECYKVASWHSVDPALNDSLQQIVCPKQSPEQSGVSSVAPDRP
jgi:hypothetical protein